MVQIMDTLREYLNPNMLVENVYVFAVLCIFLTMYGPRLHVRLPPTLMALFDNAVFRAAVLFLIAYMSHKDFVGAITITIIFMVTLNILHTHSVLIDASKNIQSEASNLVKKSVNNVSNLTSKTINNTTQVVSNTLSGTTGAIRKTASGLGNVVGNTINDASNIITEGTDNIADTVGDVADMMSNTVGGLATTASTAVNDVAGVMSSTVGDVAGLVGNTVGDTVGLMNNTFSNITGLVDTGIDSVANITRAGAQSIQDTLQPNSIELNNSTTQNNNTMNDNNINLVVNDEQSSPVMSEAGMDQMEHFAMRSHIPNGHQGEINPNNKIINGPSSQSKETYQGNPLSSCEGYSNNSTSPPHYNLNSNNMQLEASNQANNPYSLL